VTGANGPYLPEGKLMFSQSFRYLNSEDHFNGNKEQHVRHEFGNYVINEQRITDFGFSYGLTDRTSISLSIPYMLYGSWSIPLPIGPPFQPTAKGPRYKQTSEGLGDIILSTRRWMLDPSEDADGNFALGFGVKAPSGDSKYTQSFPDINGTNVQVRPVDISIQPGDGGWGGLFDFQGFYTTRWCTLFVNGSYLSNPRNTNSTFSIASNLRGVGNVDDHLRFNTVADQYLFRIGASRAIDPVPGLLGHLAWRIEGVPVRDLIGDEEGFRRPGYATFLEPGLTWISGQSSWSLSVPFTLLRNREANFLNEPGDATFADWMVLFGWTYTF
jgi:hypothetical protein